jgi:hypothetical protein
MIRARGGIGGLSLVAVPQSVLGKSEGPEPRRIPARNDGYAGFEPLREGQHDDLLFATCLGVWAWERAIEKVEYLSYPGEWVPEGVPANFAG